MALLQLKDQTDYSNINAIFQHRNSDIYHAKTVLSQTFNFKETINM